MLPGLGRFAAGMLLVCLSAACAVGPTVPGLPVELPSTLASSAGSLAIVGDLQMSPLIIRKLMRRENNREQQAMLMADIASRRQDIAALVVLGDLVFRGGSPWDWKHFDQLVAPIAERVPVLPAIGNHDYYCALARTCTQRFVPARFKSRFRWFAPGRPYWVPYGSLALLFFDSETDVVAQGRWLAQWIDEFAREFRGAVVFTHRPPFTDALMRDTFPDLALQREIVAPLRAATIVPIFFSGHAHGYEHQIVDGIHFIVSAGGGGPRGWLAADRPFDAYRGRNCMRDDTGRVLRPYNFVLLEEGARAMNVQVLGFCRGDTSLAEIERFEIALP
jgi:hypothetical protein